MTEYCRICGEPLEDEEEEGICNNCKIIDTSAETPPFDPNDVSYQ